MHTLDGWLRTTETRAQRQLSVYERRQQIVTAKVLLPFRQRNKHPLTVDGSKQNSLSSLTGRQSAKPGGDTRRNDQNPTTEVSLPVTHSIIQLVRLLQKVTIKLPCRDIQFCVLSSLHY